MPLRRRIILALAVPVLLALALSAAAAMRPDATQAAPRRIAPALCAPLPPSSGNVVTVSSVAQLQNAVNGAAAGTTILVQDGTYNLDGGYLRIAAPNVTLRSASGNPQAVVIDGNYITTEIIQVVASNVTVAELTVREAYYHPIHVMSSPGAHTLNTMIYRVRVVDGAEQAIKINPAASGYYTDNGVVACSHIELTDAGRPHVRNNCYTGGIDAHQSRGWTVRDNWVGGFWCASGLSEHGIHFWTGSRDTTIERNTLVNNARGIGCGLVESGTGRTYSDNPCPTASGYVDHYAAIIRNNTIFVNSAPLFASQFGFDCGICISQTCGAHVLHNTVVSTQAPFSSIEWRFGNTVVDLRNNLVSHNLRDRGGADTQSGNIQNAPAAWFYNAAAGDLHLDRAATPAIDTAAALGSVAVSGDFEGEPRQIGAARDVGADEYLPASIPRGEGTPQSGGAGASAAETPSATSTRAPEVEPDALRQTPTPPAPPATLAPGANTAPPEAPAPPPAMTEAPRTSVAPTAHAPAPMPATPPSGVVVVDELSPADQLAPPPAARSETEREGRSMIAYFALAAAAAAIIAGALATRRTLARR
jgi:hypothetical protein